VPLLAHRYLRPIVLVALLIRVPISTAQAIPKLGSAAPPLAMTQMLQAPEGIGVSWQALRGKAVVLEFWATWCGGCVENIPHINALAEKFKDQPLLFISITDEEKPAVLRFLKKYPISGWVALDPQRGTFKSYRVEGIPQTVLIDAKGTLRAMTNPSRVNENVLNDLLAGRVLDLPQTEAITLPTLGAEQSAPAPLLQVLIRPAASVEISRVSPGWEGLTNGRYDAWGITLRDVIADAYDVPASRVDAPEWCGQTRYDLSVVVPHGGDADRWPLVREVLATSFHLKIHHESRETSVYVLKKLPGVNTKLQVSSTSVTNSRPWGSIGEFDAVGVRLKTLAGMAGIVLASEVFDETGLQERYDFELKWNHKDPRSIIPAIREQLGLELAAQQRKLEHMVVESAEEPKTW
jgi:uncharacterized protein (TIGR03435 family)